MEDNKKITAELWLIAACFLAFGLSFLPVLSPYAFWLCLAAAAVAGRGTAREGLSGLLHLDFGEETLMLIAVVAAFMIGEYHEGAMVSLLFSLGEELEDMAVDRSKDRIKSLADIRPDSANVINGDEITVVRAESLVPGTSVLIKVGERVPVDCMVGSESVIADVSALTGESIPETVMPGEILKAGSIVLVSPVECVTVSDYGSSAAARIIDMVQNASEKKGKTEKFITRFSQIYTPSVIALAALLFFGTYLTGSLSFSDSAHRALVFLVSSCPCALVLSIPLAYFAGIGTASKAGIIIKGSEYCEKLADIRNAVFDKTGTLTSGILSVSRVNVFGDADEDEILAYAASAEKYSNHPIAKCISREAEKRGIPLFDAEKANEIAGEGITASISGKKVSVGNRKLFERSSIPVPKDERANLFVAVNGVLAGDIVLEDTVEKNTVNALSKLSSLGVEKLVMLTGDGMDAASKVAEKCGITEFYTSLLPEDKVSRMEAIKGSGTTLFTGDGINDAPVLAAADIGAAIGIGSDAAIESADIVLMKNGIGSLPDAISISRETMKCVKQNVIFIMAVKAAVLILGALGYAPIWLAVFADVGVCFIAILWSLRLMGMRTAQE